MDRRFVSWLGINEDNRLGGGPGDRGRDKRACERKQMHMRSTELPHSPPGTGSS